MLNNLLNQALSIIPSQSGLLHKFDSRTQNARNQYVTNRASAVPIDGSFQSLSREVIVQMGLDLKNVYFMLFTSFDVTGIKRGDSGDVVEYAGLYFQVLKEEGWKSVDGWDGLVLVQVTAASVGL